MKNIIVLLAIFLSVAACKNDVKEVTAEAEASVETSEENRSLTSYPSNVKAVFDAHGGIDAWSKMNALRFEIPKESGPEKHTVALSDRRSLIETNQWAIGNDGTDVWLLQQEEEAYKGNARFYHNLMFYFYAMPFVLADDGINYSPEPATELDGTSYEGIKISYNPGVGDAPKDEYVVYFDSETKLMTWLAYTVTYRTNEKSDNWRYINYADWQEVNGLTLPKTLTWYNIEDGKPTVPRSSMKFENIQVSESLPNVNLFVKPFGATISER
ncbi:MAG: DUF6503 family protein [Bacteroidota bacterium]